MSDDREPPSLPARIVAGLRLGFFYLFSALFIPVILLVAIATPGRSAYYPLVRSWARATLRIFRIRVTSEGADRLAPGQDYVLLANHRSHFDPLAVVDSLDQRQTRWVAKRELTKVPLFGYGLKVTGQILVDRRDNAQAVAALRANLGKHGMSVVFFAEGERSHGRKLAPFKKGGAAFAIDARLPVVPVAISGSEKVLPKHSLVVLPGRIRIVFGEPIATDQLGPDDRERLTALVRERVTAQLAAIETKGA